MANVLERKILIDGWRNAVVQFVGSIDSSDPAVVPALSLSDLVNNDKQLILQGLRVEKVAWTLGGGLLLALEWTSADPQKIVELAGHSEFCGRRYGGLVPDLLRAGYDGSLSFRTRGFVPGTVTNYTVVVECAKMYRR